MSPRRCRRGGAYSLINTPVTRVKPPQARTAPATPPQRGQERGRRSRLARRPDSPKLPAKPSIFREKSWTGAGGLREAPRTLRASVRVFSAETRRAEPGLSPPSRPPDPPVHGPKIRRFAAGRRSRSSRERGERSRRAADGRTDEHARFRLRLLWQRALCLEGGGGGEEPEEARVSGPLLPVQVLQRRPAGSPRHHMRAQGSVPECS